MVTKKAAKIKENIEAILNSIFTIFIGKYMLEKLLSYRLNVAFTIALAFYSGTANALSVDVGTMITNLSQSIPNLMQLVTALAYVMGMLMVIRGVYGLKRYGEQRTSHSTSDEHSLKGPLLLILVGAALIYLPTSVNVGLSTFWSEPNPYAYQTNASQGSWDDLLNSVFLIVQLIGTIAFIRGLIILTHTSSHQGGFGKAMAHIVGGILCINIYQFLQVIFNTLGIGS